MKTEENMLTIRIYFEYGTIAKHLSFWQRIWDNKFSTELLKRAKEADLVQALVFNVTRGYLKNQIICNVAEITPPDLPQCVEITDVSEKVDAFLKGNADFLASSSIVVLKEKVQVQTIEKL